MAKASEQTKMPYPAPRFIEFLSAPRISTQQEEEEARTMSKADKDQVNHDLYGTHNFLGVHSSIGLLVESVHRHIESFHPEEKRIWEMANQRCDEEIVGTAVSPMG
mmetsp:Transcript_3898/g.5812  ORF Transcript_3898/g.5812 Transcript_3898/m.5812 type:complete len:106 (+) Transcript_3898:69-386(+)